LPKPGEAERDFSEKPGKFLPSIHPKSRSPKVGLFGDYVDGADAMLNYNVDSDE